MKKVRVIKEPGRPQYSSAPGTSKARTGDQIGYGLYHNSSVSNVDDMDSKVVPGLNDIRTMYPEVDREDANIEVEQGEYVIAPDLNSLYKVGGKKHSKGGTPIKAVEGSYVVSDNIVINQPVMDILDFDYDKKKDKKKTWADVMREKVDVKYFNNMGAILKDDQSDIPVDPYMLNTAKIKMPEYQEIASKISLGNELSKALKGKPSTIPAVAQPATEALKQRAPQAGDAPMLDEAKYGGLMQFGLGDVYDPDVVPYLQAKTVAGGITPTGSSNKYNRGKDYLKKWNTHIPGIAKMKNEDAQAAIYDYMLNRNPQAIEKMWQTYGLTAQGMKDNELASMTNNGQFSGKIGRDQLTKLKKAYVDKYFGVRQLDSPDPEQTIPIPRPKIPVPGTPKTLIPGPGIGRPTPVPYTPPTEEPPIDFGNPQKEQKLGYDWRNVRDVLDSMRQDPTRYPWSAKTDFVAATPQFDDPNYYPMLAANNQRNTMLAQISSPQTARAVASYNPDLVNGFIGETQRARGNNLQIANQFAQFNAGQANQVAGMEAQRQTRDYDNTIKTLDNRDTSRALRRQNISAAMNNADRNRDQMRLLLAQNPQYTVANPWDYSSDITFLKGRSLQDPGTQGPDQLTQFKQYTDMLTEMGYSKDQIVESMKTLFGNNRDNTKTTYNGLSTQPAKRIVQDYAN